MNTVTLKVSDQFNAMLADGAASMRLSKSEWMRQAMLAFYNQPQKKKKVVTVGDLAGDLCGIFKDGPGDLSTNPRWMDDFGKV